MLFRRCKAQKRLVLSGTPVQNDLNELFVLVSFVAPGLLGTRAEFKRRYSAPILRSKELASTPLNQLKRQTQKQKQRHTVEVRRGEYAVAALMSVLKKVVLRRTQEEVLQYLLPKRTDVIIYCTLTATQSAAYDTCCRQIFG